MHDTPADRAHSPRADTGDPSVERRVHPRGFAQSGPGLVVHADPDAKPGRASRLRRLLVRLGVAWHAPVRPRRQSPGAGTTAAPAGRQARLQDLASRLAAILDELDALGLQRTAIDVCMALESVKAQIAGCDTAAPFDTEPSA